MINRIVVYSERIRTLTKLWYIRMSFESITSAGGLADVFRRPREPDHRYNLIVWVLSEKTDKDECLQVGSSSFSSHDIRDQEDVITTI